MESKDIYKEGLSSSFVNEFEALLNQNTNVLKPGKIVKGTVVGVAKEVVTVDIGFKSDGVVPTSQFQDEEGRIKVSVGDEIEVYVVQLEDENGQVTLSYERAEQMRIWRMVEDTFKSGGILTGRITQKVKGGLQVDIGIPAFLPGSQIDVRPHRNLDKFINEVYEFKVLKITKDKGNIVLSRRAVLLSERDQLRGETLKVLSEGVVMEGIVKNVTEYGAFIDLGGIDGLLHITDISWGRVNHPADKLTVGAKIPVVVLKYDRDAERVSLGIKQLKEDPWLTVAERYPVGKRVPAKVIGIVDYGVFVEMEEGVEGLIHISDLSWTKKPKHPSKIVSEGEQLDVQVLGIDFDERRVSLGLKQLMPNPWEEFSMTHPIGSHVKGKVRTIAEFGIFIGIADGIDGLVHVSDFSWTKRIKDPKEIANMFTKGQEVEAVVLEIDVEKERLSLGIKQLSEDPWDKIALRYPVGSRISGKVTTIADFGLFVEIEDGIEGVIHNSQLGLDKDQDVKEVYPVGTEVESEVISIDREGRKVSLSISVIRNREAKDSVMGYMGDGSAEVVSLGDIIREKLNN